MSEPWAAAGYILESGGEVAVLEVLQMFFLRWHCCCRVTMQSRDAGKVEKQLLI